MSRFNFAAANSASQERDTRFRILADINTASGTWYVCTGMQTIYTLGNTYSPVGGLGGLEPVQEAVDAYPRAIRMWLRAVNSSDLSAPLTENLFGRKVILRRAWLSNSNSTLVSTPEICWTGAINKSDINLGDPQRGNHFEIEVESRLRQEPRAARFNKESLWNASVTSSNGVTTSGVYSGDTFFNFISMIPGFQSGWGNHINAQITGTLPSVPRGRPLPGR